MILRPYVGKNIRVTITCDRGQYSGDMMIELWELLSPSSLSKNDFESYQRQMGGFSHTSATITLPSQQINKQNFHNWISLLIQKKLNISLIQQGRVLDSSPSATATSTAVVPSSPEDEWRYSGSLQKEMREEKLLITLIVQR